MDKEFWKLSVNDVEQEKYKNRMQLCYVVFIDILGFKEMAEQDIDKVILAMRMLNIFAKKTYKNVNGKFFLQETCREEYSKELEPRVTTFSDSIVISAKEEYYLLSDIIYSISDLQYQLLLKGIVIRGGIELGYIYQDEFMVFGDGLIEAYKLESEKAKFPRILIGNKALEQTVKRYDDEFNQKIEDSVIYNYSEIEKANIYGNYYSSDAIGAIVKDEDVHYIDFLYDNLKIYFLRDEKVFNSVKKIIIDGMKHKEEKVRKKYEWLIDEYNWTVSRCVKDIKVTKKNEERAKKLEQRYKIIV